MDKDKKQLTISFNYRTLLLLLAALYVLTVGIMLYAWQPWDSVDANARKITVTGEALVEAEPDEFQFSPTYNITADGKDEAIQEAAQKSTEVVDELKKIGVEDKNIKVNGSSHEWYWYPDEDDKNHAYVNITVTVSDKDMAQKVQDYLLTTEPEGQITPYPTFSETKKNELEIQARSEAVADAKTKAQASANELEVKLGKVISISEGQGFGDYPIAYAEKGVEIALDSTQTSSIPVQPGQNEFRYSVTVVYEIK